MSAGHLFDLMIWLHVGVCLWSHVSFILTVFCTYFACETCQRRSHRSPFTAVLLPLQYSNLITPAFYKDSEKIRSVPTFWKTFGRRFLHVANLWQLKLHGKCAYCNVSFLVFHYCWHVLCSHNILALALNINHYLNRHFKWTLAYYRHSINLSLLRWRPASQSGRAVDTFTVITTHIISYWSVQLRFFLYLGNKMECFFFKFGNCHLYMWYKKET